MKISLVTPVWNGERFIAECMASVNEQTFAPHQHIIVDSLSSDGTGAIIGKLSRPFTQHFREKDAGIYDGMNKGIARCTGDIVGIINSDDWLDSGALSKVREIFLDDAVDYVYSGVRVVDESGAFLHVREPINVDRAPGLFPFGMDWRFYTPFPHPSLFVRKRVYDRLGMYDVAYRYSADHHFMTRLIIDGAVGKCIDTPLATFRLGGASSGGLKIFMEDYAIAINAGMPRSHAVLNLLKCVASRALKGEG
jgi:glycosyltransferase involved in cell wall biosynthesis